MMVIYHGKIGDPGTQNHPKMYVQGQSTNLSFSKNLLVEPQDVMETSFYSHYHNLDTLTPLIAF